MGHYMAHLPKVPGTDDMEMPTALKALCAAVHDNTFYFKGTTDYKLGRDVCHKPRRMYILRLWTEKGWRLEKGWWWFGQARMISLKGLPSHYAQKPVPLTTCWQNVLDMAENIKICWSLETRGRKTCGKPNMKNSWTATRVCCFVRGLCAHHLSET